MGISLKLVNVEVFLVPAAACAKLFASALCACTYGFVITSLTVVVLVPVKAAIFSN